jgi:hypothetical protein
VSSKALAKPQQAAKGPAKKKKRKHSNLRSSDFDISIYTPTWRLLAEDEDPPSAAATGDGSSSEVNNHHFKPQPIAINHNLTTHVIQRTMAGGHVR